MTKALGWLASLSLLAGLVMAFGELIHLGSFLRSLIGPEAGALLLAPREVTQGNVQRIMYLHVPLAITGEYLACPIILIASIRYLWKRSERADRIAHASAEVGVLFMGLTIATGSIWGKPTWGAWWTWDARITTVSILFLMFVAYLLLRAMTDEPERAARYAAVVGIILALNVPLVHFSVYWWRTLHQPPSLLKPGPSTMSWSIWIPLFANLVAYALLYVYFVAKRARLLRLEEEAAA